MFKALFVKLLSLYVKQEERSYSDYIAIFLITMGLGLLVIANYVYFYDQSHKDLGRFLASGTLLISVAFIIYCLNASFKQYTRYKATAGLDTAKNELMEVGKHLVDSIGVNTVSNLFPLIRKFLPTGMAIFVTLYLIKRKLKNKVHNIIK